MSIIQIDCLTTEINHQIIHNNLSLAISAGDNIAIVGDSGSGKTTLLRSILMLQQIKQGDIRVFGHNIHHCSHQIKQQCRSRWGVLFQQGALFSSLSVLDNILFPLRESTSLPSALLRDIALLKINMVGLPRSAINKFPAELSGGMIKRAALARAIALDPEILFLDEPTAGLDPNSAGQLDALICDLQQILGLTIVMITHDQETLWQVSDKVAFLGEGKVLAMTDMASLVKDDHPAIHHYFNGPRAKRNDKHGSKS